MIYVGSHCFIIDYKIKDGAFCIDTPETLFRLLAHIQDKSPSEITIYRIDQTRKVEKMEVF